EGTDTYEKNQNLLLSDGARADSVPNLEIETGVIYKGALQGTDARTVWVGDVLIRKEAEGTDTYEKNQNLLLSDGARADSVPNLEIETGVI
ncbi:Fe-S cluster assembly protein SufD, partial [Corynebacterium diphtheriae]